LAKPSVEKHDGEKKSDAWKSLEGACPEKHHGPHERLDEREQQKARGDGAGCKAAPHELKEAPGACPRRRTSSAVDVASICNPIVRANITAAMRSCAESSNAIGYLCFAIWKRISSRPRCAGGSLGISH